MNHDRNLIGTATIALLATSLIVGFAAPAPGQQRKGATASIRVGEVVGQERVELKDDSAKKGALVGGAIGLAAGSGKSGKDRRKRAAIGVRIGAIAGSAKKNPTGMKYSVRTADGTIVQIVTDQTQIRLGDCVAVEESGGKANIRRISDTACQPESAPILNEPAIQEEMQEEAAECVAVKEELLAAETDEDVDRALRKMSILCDLCVEGPR